MKVVKLIGKGLSFIGVFLLILLITVYLMCLMFCYGPSEHARNLFVTTLLETGQMKFIVGLLMNDDDVQKIVNSNSMQAFEAEIDNSLLIPIRI